MKTGEEVDGAAVAASCDALEMFEFVEEAFDPIAPLVGAGVVRDEYFPGPVGRDDGLGAGFGDQRPQGVAVIGLVGDHRIALGVGEQGRSHGDVAAMMKRKGRPSASVRAWILAVSPPRERPRA